jgi:putative nucleotidyltransferase with HDIG domain
MKQTFQELWQQARPYYKKGRPMDIDHIEWMMPAALYVAEQEGLDEELLIPLVLLHDVGYANTPKGNPFNHDIKRIHMAEGAKIAAKLLSKTELSKEKREKLVYYVSIHDNWIFGDDEIYKNDPIMGNFTDLDYIWMATIKGFPAMQKILELNPDQMYLYLMSNEKPLKRPFSSKTTKGLYERYLEERRVEYNLDN